MKKSNVILQAAIASALLANASAYAAGVSLDAPSVPAVFAKEIIATVAAPVTLLDAGGVIDIGVLTGYSMNAGEVRYVRMELDNLGGGAKFDPLATVSVVAGGAGACTVGAINGLGTSVIYFSLTAGAGGCDATSAITVTGAQIITNTNTVSAAFSMYDQPSQAQGGGATGRIVNKAFTPYITFATSYVATGSVGTTVVADVQAKPNAFDDFIPSGLTVKLGTIDYRLAAVVPLKAAGTAITLTDLMATGPAGTKLVVTGDFSAAPTTGTPAVLNPADVFLASDGTCTSVLASATGLSATTATFLVGATATTGHNQLCYTVNGTTAVPVSTYTAVLTAVSATPATYAVSNISVGNVGQISHNGTELQSPFFTTATGYNSRFVLTNTGATVAPFTGVALTEAGNTCAPGTITGTIPVNGQLVIRATDVCAGSPIRGAVVFNIAAPNAQIQGETFTQSPDGTFTVTPLLRPGTN